MEIINMCKTFLVTAFQEYFHKEYITEARHSQTITKKDITSSLAYA